MLPFDFPDARRASVKIERSPCRKKTSAAAVLRQEDSLESVVVRFEVLCLARSSFENISQETGIYIQSSAARSREIDIDVKEIATDIEEIGSYRAEIATYLREIAANIKEIDIYITETAPDSREIRIY